MDTIRNIIIGFVNMVMGFIPLGFGIYYNSIMFIVAGSVIAGVGFLMIIINVVYYRIKKIGRIIDSLN